MEDRKEHDDIIEVGGLRLDTVARTVTVNGERMHFAGKEYLLMELLVRRRGEILTKAAILDHLYGPMSEPELKIVDVFVTHMRKMLAAVSGGHQYIATIWGQGYTLGVPRDDGSQT